MNIIGLVHEENGAFGLSFPDLPGCMTAADSVDMLLDEGKEALDLHLEGMLADGDEIPRWRSIQELRMDPEVAEDIADAALVVAIPVDGLGKAVKVTITLDALLLNRLNREATRLGTTRSGFIAEAVRRRLSQSAA